MTLEQTILAKRAELHAHPIHQQMVNGQISKEMYLRYLREIKFIHDYIDHKAEQKDFMDINREISLHVDILELVNDLYPLEVITSNIGEDYAIMNMFQPLDKAKAHGYVHYREYLETSDMLKGVVPGKGRIYTFQDKVACLQYLENNKPGDEWIDECIKAYDIRINILKELEKVL